LLVLLFVDLPKTAVLSELIELLKTAVTDLWPGS
jgi:hypothetical protein